MKWTGSSKNTNYLKLPQQEIGNLTSPLSIKEIEFVI